MRLARQHVSLLGAWETHVDGGRVPGGVRYLVLRVGEDGADDQEVTADHMAAWLEREGALDSTQALIFVATQAEVFGGIRRLEVLCFSRPAVQSPPPLRPRPHHAAGGRAGRCAGCNSHHRVGPQLKRLAAGLQGPIVEVAECIQLHAL